MKDFPLVSVVVPCYNLHAYILECLQSLAQQDYPNYEVLVVDDGSADDSATIIQNFIQDKPQFQLIRKTNAGLSAARNTGIHAAKGEWVSFVDGDDMVGPKYLSSMMDALRRHPAQLCIAGAMAWNVQTGQRRVCRESQVGCGALPEDLERFDSCVFVWARMYDMKIIREHNVLYDETLRFGEDRAFNFSYLRFVRQYVFADDKSYLYREARSGSLTTSIVYPWQKGYVFDYVRAFLDACGEAQSVMAVLKGNRKLLGHMADMLLGDTINAALSGDAARYRGLVNDPLAQFILSSYTPSTKKTAFFTGLAQKKRYLLTVLITKVYYSKPIYHWLKRHRLG